MLCNGYCLARTEKGHYKQICLRKYSFERHTFMNKGHTQFMKVCISHEQRKTRVARKLTSKSLYESFLNSYVLVKQEQELHKS